MVRTDFSKAFDLVDHTILIEKMIRMRIRRSIVPWICDFLHNCQQCVRFNDVLSDYVPLHGGVPQGTKLGPIGFQILINEAAENSSSKCWKYVDDLTFADNSTCAHYPSSSLQADLDDFTKWSKDNMLKLNPSKCQALQVYFGKNPLQPGNLRISSEPLSYVNEAKVLGLYLENGLKWNTQVDNMLKKANKRLFMLRTLKRFGFSSDEVHVVYSGYVRPILEYADVVWHSSITFKQSRDIESIQRRACRIILGNSYESYVEALGTCQFDSLFERRENHCHRFAEGLPHNERTKSLLPPSRFETLSVMVAPSANILQIPVKTKCFENSPLPYFIKILNK